MRFSRVCVAGFAVAVPVIYAGYRLDAWVGLDTAEREGTLPDVVFSIIVIIIGGALGLISANRLARPWFGIFAALAAGLIALVVSFATSADPVHDPGGTWAFVAGALVMLAIGLGFLRVSIIADRTALTVTNLLHRRAIPWNDLEDVVLVEVEAPIQFGLHQLALETRDGKRVTTAATGLVKPGCRLERLQRDLLAMRDRYTSTPAAP